MKESVKTVWKQLTKLAKENGSINVAVKKIKKITGLGESTIREATKDLATEGIIKKIHKFVPDRRTGKRKQVQNEYVIVTPFSSAHSGGGRGSRSGGVKILSLKDLKDQKIKREEEKNSASSIHIQPDKPVQQKQSATRIYSKISFDLFQALSSNYQAPVIDYVRQTFEARYQQGLIGVPSKWIAATLANEQQKYDAFGRVGFVQKKQNSVPSQSQVGTKFGAKSKKQQRPQVEMVESPDDQLSPEVIAQIRAMARAYEKDRTQAV